MHQVSPHDGVQRTGSGSQLVSQPFGKRRSRVGDRAKTTRSPQGHHPERHRERGAPGETPKQSRRGWSLSSRAHRSDRCRAGTWQQKREDELNLLEEQVTRALTWVRASEV